ncbi:MAG: hypothetical protein A2Y17_11430 [Clostridiales bacterium GWF2_38_85]|nr:MAG: hypothetical protein A2Y17_11430 [Clostridiales bacterium GWF2_38_85]HBL85084.1 hypothetical protein [Clostridiales bacterium]
MKKKFISFVLCLVLCVSISISNVSASTTGYDYTQAKMITLFLSQCTTNGYTLDSSFDWDAFANCDATGVVIVPFYSSANGNLFNIGNSGLTNYTGLASTVATVINELIDENSSIKIWFGTPGIDSTCYTSATSAICLNTFTNYVTAVKNALTTSRWNNNVVGVYYNQESIYGTVNYSNIYSNAEIYLMNNFAYRVHANFYRDTLWIPYYGYGVNAATIIKNIGYVANTTNIFDCVIMQSNYMAHNDAESLSNFVGICYSVDNQYVCYRDGVQAVAKGANINTVIGAEMELNTWNQTTYSTYVSYYSQYVGNEALAFYWQGVCSTALTIVDAFY